MLYDFLRVWLLPQQIDEWVHSLLDGGIFFNFWCRKEKLEEKHLLHIIGTVELLIAQKRLLQPNLGYWILLIKFVLISQVSVVICIL